VNRRRAVSIGVILVAVAISAWLSFRRSATSNEPPIRVEGTHLIVENHTPQSWRDVTVTLNAYYRGVSPTLESGGRLEAPLGSFVSGLGYRFNPARERVSRVEVRATDAAGRPVALDWEEK
jgi:hypothetical protein